MKHPGFALLTAFFFAVIVSQAFSQQKPDAMASYRQGRDLESRGRASEADAKYSEAENVCLDEIRNNVATMETYVVLTWALQRQKKYGEVITRGNEALSIRRDYRVIETMGEAYFYLGNFDASLRYMQQYVDNVSSGERTSVAYFFIGEIYRFQKKFRYADIAYTIAVRLTPGMTLWWYRLGQVRESIGDNQFASEAYENALKIDPNNRPARAGLERTRQSAALS
jgi:tetratricopeptide (TPR) repeat protein